MIDIEREGPVFVLRMQDGENRLNGPFVEALNGALDEVERAEGEAALVTVGDGRFYSTGLDLEWLASGQSARDLMANVHKLFARVLTFPMATVAAINGHAFAAGAMLAVAHDFRVMRVDKGYVCLPEVDLGTGLPLTPGMHALLDARLPRAVVHEALVTGRRYNATESIERGLVTIARPEGDVLPYAIEMARALAGKHRATLGAIKRGLFESATEVLGRPIPDWLPDT